MVQLSVSRFAKVTVNHFPCSPATAVLGVILIQCRHLFCARQSMWHCYVIKLFQHVRSPIEAKWFAFLRLPKQTIRSEGNYHRFGLSSISGTRSAMLLCLTVWIFSQNTRAVTDASVVVIEILVSRPLQYTSISCRDGVVFWLGTFEKEGAYLKTKIICQINTLLSWIRLLCVAENRFFSNLTFAFDLLQVSDGWWRAETTTCELTTSGGKQILKV